MVGVNGLGRKLLWIDKRISQKNHDKEDHYQRFNCHSWFGGKKSVKINTLDPPEVPCRLPYLQGDP